MLHLTTAPLEKKKMQFVMSLLHRPLCIDGVEGFRCRLGGKICCRGKSVIINCPMSMTPNRQFSCHLLPVSGRINITQKKKKKKEEF